jgi:hypothetical protein
MSEKAIIPDSSHDAFGVTRFQFVFDCLDSVQEFEEGCELK